MILTAGQLNIGTIVITFLMLLCPSLSPSPSLPCLHILFRSAVCWQPVAQQQRLPPPLSVIHPDDQVPHAWPGVRLWLPGGH